MEVMNPSAGGRGGRGRVMNFGNSEIQGAEAFSLEERQ